MTENIKLNLKFPFYKGVAVRSNDGVCSICNKNYEIIFCNNFGLPRIFARCSQ
jgi:hypothetical protein